MSLNSAEQPFTELVPDQRESSIELAASQSTASSMLESTEAEESGSNGNSGSNGASPKAKPKPAAQAQPRTSRTTTNDSSCSIPGSNHPGSEFSTSTDETQDKKGSYKLPIQEKHGRKKLSSEPDLKAADVSILPDTLRYNWVIDSIKKDEVIKIGSLRYKGRKLRMEARLMPGISQPNGVQMAKLLVTIQLGNANPELYKYKVYAHATMYDNEADKVMDEYKRNYKFPEKRSSIKIIMNLCKQELIEKSERKNLEILVEVKVYGSLRKFNELNVLETDGYLNVTI